MSKEKAEIPPRAIRAAQEMFLPLITIVTEKGGVRADGYWWPNKDNERACCRRVALGGSRYVMLNHVQSKGHCARRHGISAATLNKAIQVVKVMQVLDE